MYGGAIGWLAALAQIMIVPTYIVGYYCLKGGAQVELTDIRYKCFFLCRNGKTYIKM